MKYFILLCGLVLCGITNPLQAQCLRTYRISFIDPQSKEPFAVTDNAYLKTGYQLWQETGNELYKRYNWKGIYVCVYHPNKNPIIGLVKVGKGSDLAGTKGNYKLLSF